MAYILAAICLLSSWDISVYHGVRLSPLKYEGNPSSHFVSRYMATSFSLTRWVKKDRAVTVSYERIQLMQWPTKDSGGNVRDGVAIWYGFLKKGVLFGPGMEIYYNGFSPLFRVSSEWFIYGIDFRVMKPGLLRFHRIGFTPFISFGYIPTVNQIFHTGDGVLEIRPERKNLFTFDLNLMLSIRL